LESGEFGSRNRVTSAVPMRDKDAMSASLPTPEPSLTSLSHGGGCGCKLSPAVLREVLARAPQGVGAGAGFANLMVGRDTSDDAAVWRLNDQQALVATTDFFMPVVDDPYVFGRIAATNALSDIYAMGGTPIMALAIVGMPVNVLSPVTIGRILEGGESICAEAGVPIAGGHSIDSVEPIYGLVALGLVHPDHVLTNRTARPGDVLLLTKGLGVGVFSAALKQGRLSDTAYAAMVASTTQLNRVGRELAGRAGVSALTDVTGFGLLGHGLELAQGAGVTLEVDADAVPLLPEAEALIRGGVRTGASPRNWASYGDRVDLPEEFEDWRRDLLCDPQTSGGLLVAVAPDEASGVLELIRAAGFDRAAAIGRVVAGEGRVRVSAGSFRG
jgi:selenide, water dikinase